jgi:nucleotide-binding universal stress UspA family protein
MWAGTQAEREAMILDLVEEIDADLIAVGSRGMGPIKRLALGSVSTKVVRAAREPVLVYSYRRTQDRD